MGHLLVKFQDLRVTDLLTRETKEWNVDLIERVLPQLVDKISLLKPSLTDGKDGIAWLASRFGIYLTRSGYYTTVENEHNEVTIPPVRDWKKLIWTGRTSHESKLFLWKATQGALSTRANLQQRGLLQHTTCIRCGALETVAHIFFHCEFARKIWSSTLFKLQFESSDFDEFPEALRALKEAICLPPVGVLSNLFPWVYWYIWSARNQLIFEGRIVSPDDTVTQGILRAREWQMAQPTV